MPLINWTDDLSVNIKSIDEQHKKLVSLINDLSDAMKVGKGSEIIGSVLGQLADYTKTHFAYEEKLMSTHGYAGFMSQKKEHDEFAKKVNSTLQDFKAGKVVMSVEIMQFLKDWLTGHIKGSDKKYSGHLSSKGVA